MTFPTFQNSKLSKVPFCEPCKTRGSTGWHICGHNPCDLSVFINRDMYCSIETSRSPYLAEMTNGAFPQTSYQKCRSILVPDHSPNMAIPPGTSLWQMTCLPFTTCVPPTCATFFVRLVGTEMHVWATRLTCTSEPNPSQQMSALPQTPTSMVFLHYAGYNFHSLLYPRTRRNEKQIPSSYNSNQRSAKWVQQQMRIRTDITGWLIKIIKDFFF